MNGVDLTKEKVFWMGSLAVLVLLTVFPFTSQGGMFAVFQRGDFSGTIWSLMGEMPILGVFILILLFNSVLSFVRFEDRLKNYLSLALNLLGVTFFIIQFVLFTPEIPLGTGGFLIFFMLLLYLAKSLSRLGLVRGDTFISGLDCCILLL